MSLKNKYAYYLLNKQLEKTVRAAQFVNLEKVNKIGLLWHISETDAFHFITDYFQNKQVICRHLCYSGNHTEEIANSFSDKDLNWLGFPKSGIVETFLQSDFDILINISVTNSFPLQVITALSGAKFKIGWTLEANNYFDMTVDVSKNCNAKYLAEQQIFYLKQFNKD